MPVKTSEPSGSALQGLAAARPPVTAPPQLSRSQGGQHDPKQLLQVAGTVLQELVKQFGPDIVAAFQQVLQAASSPAAPQGQGGGPQTPPAVGGGGTRPGPAGPIRPPV